jgi:ribosomal protein S14
MAQKNSTAKNYKRIKETMKQTQNCTYLGDPRGFVHFVVFVHCNARLRVAGGGSAINTK